MKVCLFDIDGTLLLTGGVGKRAFAATFAREFGVEQLSEEVSFAGRSDRGITTDLFRHHGLEMNEANWDRFRQAYVELLSDFLAEANGGILPGCLELIEKVEAMDDLQLGLLTGNVRRAAEQKLTHHGIWHRFAFGGFGDHHTEREGIAAEARQAAREQHNQENGQEVSEERIVVIGDTPNDVLCARSIGAYAVAVATGPTPAEALEAAEPDLLLDSLEDHGAILDWLMG